MLNFLKKPDIFNTSHGETPVFGGKRSESEGCNNSSDFWKVIKHTDGSITMIDDESDDVTIVDEATGESEVFKYTGGSKTGFIGDTLGITKDEVNAQMGAGAGWSYVDGDWQNTIENQTVNSQLIRLLE